MCANLIFNTVFKQGLKQLFKFQNFSFMNFNFELNTIYINKKKKRLFYEWKHILHGQYYHIKFHI